MRVFITSSIHSLEPQLNFFVSQQIHKVIASIMPSLFYGQNFPSLYETTIIVSAAEILRCSVNSVASTHHVLHHFTREGNRVSTVCYEIIRTPIMSNQVANKIHTIIDEITRRNFHTKTKPPILSQHSIIRQGSIIWHYPLHIGRPFWPS